MTINKSTLDWWNKQNQKVRYEAIDNNTNRIELKEALLKFNEWFHNNNIKYVWANSPSFDCVILEQAYKKTGVDIPWKYWNLRDCRTIIDLARIRVVHETNLDKRNDNSHHSLYDCYKQILNVQKSYYKLKCY